MSTSVGQNTLIRSKDKPEQAIVQVKAKVSPILDKSFHKSSTTCMMHLSLSKSVITGTKEHEFKGEEPPGATPVMDQKMVQDTMQSMLLKEAKPVIKVSQQGKFQTPPLDTSTDVCVLGTGRTNEIYKLIVVPKKEPDPKLSHEPISMWKPKSEQSIVQVPKPVVRFLLDKHVLNISMTDIMHLLFVQNVENFSVCKEESFKEIPPDYLMLLGGSTPKMIRKVATKTLKDHPLQKRCKVQNHRTGVILSYLSKEEPPDAQSIPKPKQYQGKTLESQKSMKADLLYLGAGYPVSRSKLCQGGGYDAVIRSATEPEVNPKPYSTSQGANQDIRALKIPYLTNQEGLNHESNFDGFYTQEGVQANWNWANIFTEQEVMNFTIQRFLNPSICEYPTLEEDSSSIKERPEAKPIIGVKRSLSAFQKAQDQEKWPRKLGVMINSPEPAKPTSSMESLQPIQLGSTQSYLWEPGDHLNQSGGIPEVLSCTRTQEISWFNGESLKPNRSYLWKDWTIFRFDPFQAIPIQPGGPEDVQKKSRHPGDIIHKPEEFYNFIPCTSPHRNKKIPIITKLPYLESQALKLQQLFFLQSMHDISTFQTIKKIPRKLTYPLKPSRYKEDTIYIHLAKILIIKPPTASFQGAINSFASKFIISIFISFLMSFYDC